MRGQSFRRDAASLRELIYRAVADAAPFAGEIEVDESYFGGHRQGKRGRGAAGKVLVFGLLKRGGKVYAVLIADAKATTWLPILKARIVPDSIVYSDALPSDNALNVSGFRHRRLNHSKRFTDGKNNINGIETFGTRPSVTGANLTVFPKPVFRYS